MTEATSNGVGMVPADKSRIFGRNVSKVEHCGWKIADRPGTFAMVSKHDLHIDQAYQRDKISNARVLEIASVWAWAACLVLAVARRPDGSLWVFDGQHRLLASLKRDDIEELPCLIFDVEDIEDEAMGFVSVNTVRGSVSSYHRFRALLVAGNEAAYAVQKMVTDAGYKVVNSSCSGKGSVSCVATLLSQCEKGGNVAADIFAMMAHVYDGQSIDGDTFAGMCFLERHLRHKNLGSLLESVHVERLRLEGSAGIEKFIGKARDYYSRGGAKVYAQGVVNLLNKLRRTRKLPNVIDADDSDE